MNKFVVVYECKEAKSDDGTVMTKAGERALVQVGEWGPTAFKYPSFAGLGGAMIFDTREEALKFGKSFKGHPWYYKSSGKFEVIEVEPIYKVSGYKEANQ